MGETGLVSTLYGVPSQRTLKRGHRTIRYQPHSTLRVSFRTGISKSEAVAKGTWLGILTKRFDVAVGFSEASSMLALRRLRSLCVRLTSVGGRPERCVAAWLQ